MPTVDEDLGQLERDIRQLKIEYEQYFNGGRARPPSDTEWRIELIIRRYADRGAEISYGQRFRYNNLAQTYAKYKEVFRKRFQQREEGTVQRHYGAAARAIQAERAKRQPRAAPTTPASRPTPPHPSASQPEPAPPFAVDCSDPDREAEKVEKLYQAFRSAKQGAGENTDRLTLDSFQQFLRQKTAQLKEQKGCRQVEYVVEVDGGQVKLKARVKQ